MKDMFMYSTSKYSHLTAKTFGGFGYTKHMPSGGDTK
jgi:hypothetical protein